MQRRLFNLAVFLSIALMLAVMVMWMRGSDGLGYAHATIISGRYARKEWTILSKHGGLEFTKADIVPVDASSASALRYDDQQLGLGWYRVHPDPYTVWRGISWLRRGV